MRELAPIYSAAMPSRLRTTLVTFLGLALALGVVATIASAQEATDSAPKKKLFDSIDWLDSGETGPVGSVGTLSSRAATPRSTTRWRAAAPDRAASGANVRRPGEETGDVTHAPCGPVGRPAIM
jgi:hypothetical protein